LPLFINFFGPKTGLAQLVSVDPFTASLCQVQDIFSFLRQIRILSPWPAPIRTGRRSANRPP